MTHPSNRRLLAAGLLAAAVTGSAIATATPAGAGAEGEGGEAYWKCRIEVEVAHGGAAVPVSSAELEADIDNMCGDLFQLPPPRGGII